MDENLLIDLSQSQSSAPSHQENVHSARNTDAEKTAYFSDGAEGGDEQKDKGTEPENMEYSNTEPDTEKEKKKREEEFLLMSARSLKTARSPEDLTNKSLIITPITGMKHSTPLTKDAFSGKRKRVLYSPLMDDNIKVYMDIVNKMCSKSETLNRLVKENKNTKKEIKEVIKSLSD